MAENENKNQDLTKFLTIILAAMTILFIVSAGVNYVLMDNLVAQKVNNINISQEELEETETLLIEDKADELEGVFAND